MTAPVRASRSDGRAPVGSMAVSPLSVAERVAETFDALFATIDGWRDRLVERLELETSPTASALDPFVEASTVPELESDGLITGSGFVAAPGLLSDAQWHLAWWLGGPAGIRRLATIDDPSNDQFRDYTTLEWWRFPARTGTRHLTGPYVDYVCTDDYTVTITTPVLVAGELLGVVGMDVLVDRLERELLPLLRERGTPTTIVNASGSIVSYSALIGQVGDKWIGRSRSNQTSGDAMPEITATAPIVANKITHLVLVANASARILYVDGMPYSSSPSGAGTVDWDEAYKLRLGDAITYDRQWLGTIWLLAIYDRALSAAEVKQNFDAKHDCTSC